MPWFGQHKHQSSPRCSGCLKKTDLNPSENHEADLPQKFIWLPRMIDLDERFASHQDRLMTEKNGQLLLHNWRHCLPKIPLTMDRAYESEETRECVVNCSFNPVVPPQSNRLKPWIYDKVLYKRRNEIERLFRRLKGFRRVFSRFEKLDLMFSAFIHLALIVEMIKEC